MTEIEEALGSPQLEFLEDYASDPRGASGLFLGFTNGGQPIHAVRRSANPRSNRIVQP